MLRDVLYVSCQLKKMCSIVPLMPVIFGNFSQRSRYPRQIIQVVDPKSCGTICQQLMSKQWDERSLVNSNLLPGRPVLALPHTTILWLYVYQGESLRKRVARK